MKNILKILLSAFILFGSVPTLQAHNSAGMEVIKKKKLTGNAYYAKKAQKNFYYQGIGAKGGRPRIYNKIET